MSADTLPTSEAVLPVARYRDLANAIVWLEKAFGFEKRVAVSDTDGDVIFAHMRYGSSAIMLGAVRGTDIDQLMCQPDEVGGLETQTCYVVVQDIDAAYERAVAGGADVVLPLQADGMGRRGFSCRDPEGHVWSFGTYHLDEPAMAGAIAGAAASSAARPVWTSAFAILLVALISGALGWGLGGRLSDSRAVAMAQMDAEAERAFAQVATLQADQRRLETQVAAMRKERDAEKRARTSAETRADLLQGQVETARVAASNTAKRLSELRKQLSEMKRAQKARSGSKKKRAGTKRKASGARADLDEETAVALARKQADAAPRRTVQATESRLETSATTAKVDLSEPPKQSVTASRSQKQTAARKKVARKKVKKAAKPKVAQQAWQPSGKPTYVIDLAIVPWPYKEWHKN